MKTIAEKIASANLGWVAVGILMFGAIVCLSGVYVEFTHEMTLLQDAGLDAFKAYQLEMYAYGDLQQTLHPTVVGEMLNYLVTGLKGELPSAGGNLQAIGLVIDYCGAAFGCSIVIASRMYVSAKVNASPSYVFSV